jgi:hypothetical protein
VVVGIALLLDVVVAFVVVVANVGRVVAVIAADGCSAVRTCASVRASNPVTRR